MSSSQNYGATVITFDNVDGKCWFHCTCLCFLFLGIWINSQKRESVPRFNLASLFDFNLCVESRFLKHQREMIKRAEGRGTSSTSLSFSAFNWRTVTCLQILRGIPVSHCLPSFPEFLTAWHPRQCVVYEKWGQTQGLRWLQRHLRHQAERLPEGLRALGLQSEDEKAKGWDIFIVSICYMLAW